MCPQAQMEADGMEGRLRARRHGSSRLSPSMEVFKRKLMEWLTSNEDKTAVQMFQVGSEATLGFHPL